ncbi:MAG: hypothetical protein JPMHGGIA_00634 [Saprospiraceae bacterium]|jgi:uncharacterized protein (DUF58 family)|nr:hypothetical protein [Saprospiraceae bacterium]
MQALGRIIPAISLFGALNNLQQQSCSNQSQPNFVFLILLSIGNSMKTAAIVFSLWAAGLAAQDVKFDVSLSSDSLLLGNYLEVRFEVRNGEGRFTPPRFEGWQVVAGPNTASSYSIINGEVSQSSTYSYALEATAAGVYTIGPATLSTSDGELKTPSVEVIVLPNPEGIRQYPRNREESKYFEDRMPETPKKTKRKPLRL